LYSKTIEIANLTSLYSILDVVQIKKNIQIGVFFHMHIKTCLIKEKHLLIMLYYGKKRRQSKEPKPNKNNRVFHINTEIS
jgi:hypothetical protein